MHILQATERIAISHLRLRSQLQEPALAGLTAVTEKHAPIQPGIVRSCSLLRDETLPIYFSTTQFILNLNNTRGIEMVLNWIGTNSSARTAGASKAFNNLRHVIVIFRSGLYDRPDELELDFHRREVVASGGHLSRRILIFEESVCYSPEFHWLRTRLRQIPENRDADEFDMGELLRDIVEGLIVSVA